MVGDPELPPDVARAVDWARAQMGWRSVCPEPLRGGWTSTMLLLRADPVDDSDAVVLRVMTKQPWRTHAAGLLGREAEVQRQLVGTGVTAPRSLALDADGHEAGAPAHLMTRLPGRVELSRTGAPVWDELARVLRSIHDVEPGPAERPRSYQSWAGPAKHVVPTWCTRPASWKRAFALLADTGPPAFEARFLHRDFHVGNVLWQDGLISGVVDWVETSWGPARLDLAHAATYTAMLHGQQAASDLERAYDRLDDGPDVAGNAYWDVMDVVGYLPDPAKVVQPWRDLGCAITDELARERLEERLAVVLTRG